MRQKTVLRWMACLAAPGAGVIAAAQEGARSGEQPAEEPRPAPVQPANARQATPPPPPNGVDVQGEVFRLEFRDGVDLSTLVDYISKELGLQIIIVDGDLLGQKVFLPTPIEVPSDQVLRLLNTLLEQKGFTLTRGLADIYFIRQAGDLDARIGEDPFNTTRLISTGGLRPSSLEPAIRVLGVTQPQQPTGQPTVRGATAQIAYLDDLGLILMTGSARQTAVVEALVHELAAKQSQVTFHRLELRYVAASYARERVLQLAGGSDPTLRLPRVAPGAQGNVAPAVQPFGAASGSLLNLEERLTVDPQGNALLFRGRPDETAEVQRLLAVVDVPNALVTRWYGVGRAALAVAQEGQRQALGEVVTEQGGILDVSGQAARGFQNVAGLQQFGAQRTGGMMGTGFVVFQEAGGFVYRGTPRQHEEVQRLIASLDELTSAELVVVEFYKLKHASATEVAEIIDNLLNNQQATGSSPLLGRDLGRGGTRTRRTEASALVRPPETQNGMGAQGTEGGAEGGVLAGTGAAGGEGEISAVIASEDTFVLADEANNQVVVKAPKRLQPQFARLIDRLDLRRPQVYIDAKIVAMTASDNFRLAFETQILAGQFGLSTDFGLAELDVADDGSGGIFGRKTPLTATGSLSAAVVKSDFVPIILRAMQENTNSRIISMPQLLVDDNEEAEVISVNRAPYGAISRTTGQPDVITQGGEAEAGTTLRVTPQISEGGYLKLEYEIELSSFTGESQEGLAPPSQVNNIRSDSVTVPSDSTIVVGGLTFDSDVKTVFKVPLLGDIPLLGQLFRDERVQKTRTTLYIFITPTIMRDPDFADLRLLTRGPAMESGVVVDLPHDGPVRIDILERSARPVLPPEPAPLEPEDVPGPVGEAQRGWIAPSRGARGAERRGDASSLGAKGGEREGGARGVRG